MGVVVVVAIVMVVVVVAPHASGTSHWLMSEQSPSAVAFPKPAQHAGVGQLPGPWWLQPNNEATQNTLSAKAHLSVSLAKMQGPPIGGSGSAPSAAL